mgnify:CR=1 FL=1
MNKKAQGISMNVIIIAAIALLVLVVLSVVFMGRMGIFSSGSADCGNQGGTCLDECGPGQKAFSGATCEADDQDCCIVGDPLNPPAE